MEFGDLRSAARMRDLIERIVTKTIDKKRPEVRIGYVNNYDSGRQLAWIKFPGDDELVKVRIALNMLPTRTIAVNGEASADIVRVAGKPGAYYVTDFVRGVPQNQIYFKNDGLPYFVGADGAERPFRVTIALHANPGFEEWSGGKPVGWGTFWRDSAAIPAAWMQDTVEKVGGSSSMRIDIVPDSTGRLQTSVFPVQPGQIVRFDIWCRADSTQSTRLELSLMTKKDAAPNFFDSDTTTQLATQYPTTSGWEKFAVSWVVPSDHNQAMIDVNPWVWNQTAGTTVIFRLDESFIAVSAAADNTGV